MVQADGSIIELIEPNKTSGIQAALFMDGRYPTYGMGSTPIHSVEVTTKDMEGLPDARGDSIRGILSSDYGIDVGRVKVTLGYLIKADLQVEELQRTVYDLFADPIIEHGTCNGNLLDDDNIFPNPPEAIVQVGFKPGVTDNAGQAGLDGLTTLFPELEEARVATTRTYLFWDLPELSLIHI